MNPDGSSSSYIYFFPEAEILDARQKAPAPAWLAYTSARVLSVEGAEVHVETADEVVRHLSTHEPVVPVCAAHVAGVPQILALDDFSLMSLVSTLRARYERNEIYTLAGPILISLNPCVCLLLRLGMEYCCRCCFYYTTPPPLN